MDQSQGACLDNGFRTEALVAERQGFEPWVPLARNTAFPVLPIQPLWHLSNYYSFSRRGRDPTKGGGKTGAFSRSATSPRIFSEGQGFEPWDPLRSQHISSVLLSTTQPPFHNT